MAEFFRTSTIWVVDFLYDGRARRWFKAFGSDKDAHGEVVAELHALYGDRVRRVTSRRATVAEETQYLHGDEPKNPTCPTGR